MILEVLQLLRDSIKLLDEKITTDDITDIKELIKFIENNLKELKSHF